MLRLTLPLLTALAISATVSAQVTGVPGANDLTVNDQGSGSTSCVPVDVTAGVPMNLELSAASNAPVIGLVAAFCAPVSIWIDPTYSVDLDLATQSFVFDGSGFFVATSLLTPFFTTNMMGQFNFSVTAPELTTFALTPP